MFVEPGFLLTVVGLWMVRSHRVVDGKCLELND